METFSFFVYIYSDELTILHSFQVEISPESREITTFITSKGLFRYTRLMFGINCAPEIFQRIMEQILAGLLGWICFLDDILVFGENREEHDRNLAGVLGRLTEYDVLLNRDKCLFGVPSIVFLGHRLSENGIEAAEDKVEAIRSHRN